ncbi:flagellar hook-length control protein FliK [Burkholderia dolosa]|uniref:Flagellar hook-length control protein FliK n=1 Tax=Burkholderia dolosa TaxID=152500 RepID=A0A892ID44_9BURK|nr:MULTISPECIES: flagellar hook-length control protein FliK [Burkholderia]MBR8420190.1 flagellar hook-length control protein FliK [Burkholderia dolosa]MBY4658398.1 flagellar hook-length control protein FliK [Burkholderia dolosa]MBY4691881.1 flagellar hook-length control protein FliK [Burkholderia dolosa]MBY4781505.1 flagellar hook-length control protein FliK [Burkholderia dolosa]MBY4786597.1 flagellar hook-length control protein FliK [Burkholderia dolosa]
MLAEHGAAGSTESAAAWLSTIARTIDDMPCDDDGASVTAGVPDLAVADTAVEGIAVPCFVAFPAVQPPDGIDAGRDTGARRIAAPDVAGRPPIDAVVIAADGVWQPALAGAVPALPAAVLRVQMAAREARPFADLTGFAHVPGADDIRSTAPAVTRLPVVDSGDGKSTSALPLQEWVPVPDNAAALKAIVQAAAVPTQPDAAAAAAPDERSRVVAALAERIAVQASQRVQHASVQLDSYGNGHVTIELRHDRGAISVHMSAADADVVRQLQAISDSLRHELGTRQFHDVSVQVSRRGDHEAGDGRPRRDDPAPDREKKPGSALAFEGDTGTFEPA